MAFLAPTVTTRDERDGAFAALDARLVGGAPGVCFVAAPEGAAGAMTAHASRRLRQAGWLPIAIGARGGVPIFGEVAMHLGLAAPGDPIGCAAAIAAAALREHAAIVVPLPGSATWDAVVAEELARAAGVPVVFVGAAALPDWCVSTFAIEGELSPHDKHLWLAAVAGEAARELAATDLRSLETWWSHARAPAPRSSASATSELGAEARAAATFLALAARPLPARALGAAADDLVRAGLAGAGRGLVWATADLGALAEEASVEDRRAVACRLERDDADPWAHARAAELFLGAGAFAEAGAAIAKALGRGVDREAAVDLAARWFAAVSDVDGAPGIDLRIEAAERALRRGDAADAHRWCESAAALDPGCPRIHLLRGRALVLLGDLVAARVCLAKADAATADAELSARVAAERGELSYLGGDLDAAAAQATDALRRAGDARTRLVARATLGKILLAQGAYDRADEHFADDALTAAAAGDATGELRARSNRALALLSSGRLDGARVLLERVQDDAARLGEDRAHAYALSNLGLVAYRQHDFAAALRCWEQAIRLPQALRGRVATALTVANLASLRLRLGLVDHAEHAIAFGQQVGPLPPRCTALFKWVAAEIALARRDTRLARREIEGALIAAHASGDRDCLESATIVSVRVALEDGDIARAADALAVAAGVAVSPRARAELAIVRAVHLRATGQPAIEAAAEALAVAREAGEEDLLSEIHVLLATLETRREAAAAHCAAAVALRDRVAADLPPDVRAAYLARPESLALSRLQDSLARGAPEPAVVSERVPVSVAPGRAIVGDDPRLRSLAVAIRKVARSNGTVLISGESGTGKELVAEALHRASERAAGPLVTVNCAALVETLLLSELFGHEKGAFTGATSRRRGRFELAEGGTLFLDEIGDISPGTQVALLRVLQEKTFERVGGVASIRADVRVVCATHRDLRAMVERGAFREDLYYRLRGITLEVPPLRARLGDLPKLSEHLLQRIAGERGEAPKRLAADAIELFARHRWPGNVRELENVLRAASLFANGEVVTATDAIENVDDLRLLARSAPIARVSAPATTDDTPDLDAQEPEASGVLPSGEATATAIAYAHVRQGGVSLSDMKRQIERDCIARALAETDGNITKAAALLGMKRPRLSQLVKQYGLPTANKEDKP